MNSHNSSDILSKANLLSYHSVSKTKCEQNQINHRLRVVKSKFNGLKMVQITTPNRRHIDISTDASKLVYKNAISSCPNESWMNLDRSTEKHRRRLRHNYSSSFRMFNLQTIIAICAAMLVLGTWNNLVSASTTIIVTTMTPSTILNEVTEETSTEDLSKIISHHVMHNGISNSLDPHKSPGSE